MQIEEEIYLSNYPLSFMFNKPKIVFGYSLAICMLLLINNNVYGYFLPDSTDIYNYDFKELSKLQVSSVSKYPQKIKEVPSSVYIITSAEINERGYFTLDEALADLPGFQFRNIQSFNSYIFQRGIPNQNNLALVLIDGIQINELNSDGFYGGGQYNLSNVDRIEVIYGPASVAYGTNAISGIINIVTKSAIEKQVEINALAGNFNTFNANFGYCYANEKKSFGIRFAGMAKKTNKADLSGADGDNNWSDLLENFEDDYSFDLKIQKDDFTLGTNYQQKQSSVSTYVKSTGTIYKDYGTLWNIMFMNNYLKYKKNLTENLSLSSVLYNRIATVLDNTVQYVVDTAQIGYYRPNYLYGIENVLHYNINKYLSLTGGLTFKYEELAQRFSITSSSSPETKPPTPATPPMEYNNLISLFLEPQVVLFDNIFISGGLRYDHSSVYDDVSTPKVGVCYIFNEHVVRFSYSEAFRAPKPWDYTDGVGNSGLKPERMQSVEAATSLSFNSNIKADFIVYKNKLNDAITKQIYIDNTYNWVNEGEINTEGLEISLGYTSPKLKVSANYTYTNSYNSDNVPIAEISKHCANTSVTYSLLNNLKLNLRANYVGKRENPKEIASTNSKYVDPFVVFNSVLIFNYNKNIELQLTVKNIFDTEYYHTSNRVPDRYRQAQRSILFSVKYSLTD